MPNTGDTAWLLASAALVMFMTVGLALFYGGLDSKRNVLSMLVMNFITISLVSITWVVVGFSLAFGPSVGGGVIGNFHYAFMNHMRGVWPGTHVPKLVFMAFQMMFAIITPALITGAVAGRLKFKAWIALCIAWSVLVYPVIAHWLFDPTGWLYQLGARDFAGGAVVHASAGVAALVLVLLIRDRSRTSQASYQPHSVPLVLLGAGILWFGWFGFNAGSALSSGQLAASTFVATQLAAASACLLWAVMERAYTGRVTVVGLSTGAVVGLATITPGSGFVAPVPALLIGAAAGVVCYLATRVAMNAARFDDAFDVVACHGVGGVLGMLLLGIFAQYAMNPSGLTRASGSHINGLIFGQGHFLVDQLIAVVAVVAFVMLATYIVGVVVNATVGLRVSAEEEERGLNLPFDLHPYDFSDIPARVAGTSRSWGASL